MQSFRDSTHKLGVRGRFWSDQIEWAMGIFVLQQKAHGFRLISDMDPRHGLFAIAKFPAEEETRSKCHQWEQAVVPGKHHRVSGDRAAYTKLLDGFCCVLP